ncbi:MAG TPA: SelB C-terminal domain-containing protein, partial [Chloroflexota bacterium]|nr:SelB C-terminal domain-containing protein [Chloroflexota bacterium]
EYPYRKGMPREEVRSRAGLYPRAFGRVEARLLAEGAVAQAGPLMALASHQVRFDAAMRERVDRYLGTLRGAAVSPPASSELLASHGLNGEVLAALMDQGKVVEVTPEIVLDKGVYDDMVAAIVEMIRAQGPITVAAVRDRFNTSRKYALAIMEHLDQKRVTKRVGDERVLA